MALAEHSLPPGVGRWDRSLPDTGRYLLRGTLTDRLVGSSVFPFQIQPLRILPGAQRVGVCCPLPCYFAAGRFGAAESLEGTQRDAKGSSAAAEEPCSGKSRGAERGFPALARFGVSEATLPSTATAPWQGLKRRFPPSTKNPRAAAVVVCVQQAWPQSCHTRGTCRSSGESARGSASVG